MHLNAALEKEDPMITTDRPQHHAQPDTGTSALHIPPRDDFRTLLNELAWFYTRDWRNIVKNPLVAKALIRRSTRAALYAEDIYADSQQQKTPQIPIQDLLSPPQDQAPSQTDTNPSSIHHNSQFEEDDPPCLTHIPVSIDRVELYDFSTPHHHEHPLYANHTVMHFCAAFYHEDEFIFARAHLQLLLTPTGSLNWLAGSRSVPVDKNYLPLPYIPGGELFHLLGLGITQLIYTNQTDLKLRMKQGHRLPPDHKLVGMVLQGDFDTNPTTSHGERQTPLWAKS